VTNKKYMLTDKIVESFRTGERTKTNPNNKFTHNRRNLYKKIKEETGLDKDASKAMCLRLIEENMPIIQRYVQSQGEMPSNDIEQLVLQTYELRCKQIQDAARISDLPENDAQILLEEEEAETEDSGIEDRFLGMFSAPIGLAAEILMNNPHDNFVDPAMITGIVNTIGAKITSGDLMRAARNKPAGILGALGTGGTKAYDALRKYLNDPKNIGEKNAVLQGKITDVAQLAGYGGAENTTQSGVKVLANDVINQVKQQEIKAAIKKYLPIAIGLIIIIFIIAYVIGKKHKG
jgi:hypothetical protein